MSRVAIIDLGTNSFKVLLADIEPDGKVNVLLRNKLPVKIAEGGVLQNTITTEAFQRGITALRVFKHNIIDYFEADRVFAFATEGIRTANNGQWFVDYVRQNIGIQIEIISGQREAELIYHGVRQAIDFGSDYHLLCDIGGGSTEFIIGNAAGIVWKESFKLGALHLHERFSLSDPIKKSEVADLEDYVAKQLSPLLKALKKYPVKRLVGSSGAFSTLSRMASFHKYNHDTQKHDIGIQIPMDAFEALRDKILALTHEERKFLPGLKLFRVKMMPPAIVLINFIVKKIKFEEVFFSDYSLNEGVISWVRDRVLAEQKSN